VEGAHIFMAINIRSFVLYTTIISIFSEALFVRYGFDIKAFYLVLIINTLLIIPAHSIYIHTYHFILLCLLAISGIIGILAGTNDLIPFLFTITGISASSIYYYNFFKYQNISIEKIFNLYFHIAYLVALIGLLIFCYDLIIGNELKYVKSIMLEPAHYCAAVMPALYYGLQRTLQEREHIWKSGIILVSIGLSGSSVGFVGLLLILFFLFARNIKGTILGIIAVSLSFAFIYTFSDKFNLRVDDTLRAIQTGAVDEVNLSTYSLIKNTFIATESFKRNPLLGGGLGSHVVSHEKFVDSIPGIEMLPIDFIELNSKDASSLANRVVSELGIIGVIFLLTFLYYFRNKNNAFNTAAFIYFLLKLLRNGHYFTPETYFFVMVFVLTSAAAMGKPRSN